MYIVNVGVIRVQSQLVEDSDGNQSSDETSNIQSPCTVNGDSQQGRNCSTPQPINIQKSESKNTGESCMHKLFIKDLNIN
jgi:hypothetical protein